MKPGEAFRGSLRIRDDEELKDLALQIFSCEKNRAGTILSFLHVDF